MKHCVFCGQPGDTKEHVLPRWLQKHFSLKDQHLQMINKTKMQYCRVVLPACKKCNSEIFSRLELKVQQNTASEQEYYLWALKIRYCLSVIDSLLPNDRSNPSSGPILLEQFSNIGHDFIKHAFTHLAGEKFYFRPYPFGSVFLLNNPIQDGNFGFVDVSHPYWALTISLPNHRILSVLFTDRGLVKRSLQERYRSKVGLAFLQQEIEKSTPTGFYAQYLTFRLLLSQYQLSNIPYEANFNKTGVYSKRLPNKLKYREKLKLSVINQISDFCGLPQEVAQTVYKSLPEIYRG